MPKFLDKVIILPNCKYYYGKKAFSSIEKAIKYASAHDNDFNIKTILIKNKNASGLMPECFNVSNRDVMSYMTPFAKDRYLCFSSNMDEIYFEYFDLFSDENRCWAYTFSIDYGIIYGNISIDKYLNNRCVSTILPYTFVPMNLFDSVKDMDAKYEGKDFSIVLACSFKSRNENGDIESEDFGYREYSVPSSTFILQNASEPDKIKDYDIDPYTYPPKKYTDKNPSLSERFWCVINRIRFLLDHIRN